MMIDTVAHAFTHGQELQVTPAMRADFHRWLHQQWTAMIDSGISVSYTDRETTLSESIEGWTDGKLLISTVGNDPNPKIMDRRQNLQFRAIHDAAHAKTGFGADWQGELGVTLFHLATAPRSIHRILASEVAGQAAVAITTGQFPDQRLSADVLWAIL